MITKFDTLYAGHVDMENVGYAGIPVNDRHFSNSYLVFSTKLVSFFINSIKFLILLLFSIFLSSKFFSLSLLY